MPIEQLKRCAFREGPGAEANQLIEETRVRVRAAEGRAINYEVALLGRPWAYLREEVAPRLALYLRSKRLSVRQCGPVFLSLFVEERVYFIHAADFFRIVREAEGLDEESFLRIAEVWEQTGRAARGALPPVGN